MNDALFSSKKMDYCTPQAFFDQLNEEFRFELDAAAAPTAGGVFLPDQSFGFFLL